MALRSTLSDRREERALHLRGRNAFGHAFQCTRSALVSAQGSGALTHGRCVPGSPLCSYTRYRSNFGQCLALHLRTIAFRWLRTFVATRLWPRGCDRKPLGTGSLESGNGRTSPASASAGYPRSRRGRRCRMGWSRSSIRRKPPRNASSPIRCGTRVRHAFPMMPKPPADRRDARPAHRARASGKR